MNDGNGINSTNKMENLLKQTESKWVKGRAKTQFANATYEWIRIENLTHTLSKYTIEFGITVLPASPMLLLLLPSLSSCMDNCLCTLCTLDTCKVLSKAMSMCSCRRLYAAIASSCCWRIYVCVCVYAFFSHFLCRIVYRLYCRQCTHHISPNRWRKCSFGKRVLVVVMCNVCRSIHMKWMASHLFSTFSIYRIRKILFKLTMGSPTERHMCCIYIHLSTHIIYTYIDGCICG